MKRRAWGQLESSSLLAVSVGIQLLIAALLYWGPRGETHGSINYSFRASRLLGSENDLPIYAVGLLVTVVAAIFFSGRGESKRILVEGAASSASGPRRLHAALATVSFVIFGLMLLHNWPEKSGKLPPQLSLVLPLTVPAALAIVYAAWVGCIGKRVDGRWKIPTLDLIAIAVICAAVYQPFTRCLSLSGRDLLSQGMHHWNYFMMGPALAFAHGKALYAETYSQYGVGWPLVGAMLHSVGALSYTNLIHLSSMWGCAYFAGLYWLILRLTGNRWWAWSGTLLAIYATLYNGVDAGDSIWEFPSSTFMRHPVDIACFHLMLSYRQRAANWKLALIGAVNALALAFELDTGLYLLATTVVFLGCLWTINTRAIREILCRAALLLLPVLIGCSIAATIASRGHPLNPLFWSGLTEGIRYQSYYQLGFLPVSTLPPLDLVAFVVALVILSTTLVRSWPVPDRDRGLVLVPSLIAGYGLCIMLLFVGRSHPDNLWHCTVPLATALSVIGFRWSRRTIGRSESGHIGVYLALSLAIALIYNGVLSPASALTTDPEAQGTNLRDDPPDLRLPFSQKELAETMRQVSLAMRKVSDGGGSVAVFDRVDTPLYVLADIAPWSRYSCLYTAILDKDMMTEQLQYLADHPPQLIVMMRNTGVEDTADVDAAFRAAVKSQYVLKQQIGPWDLFGPN